MKILLTITSSPWSRFKGGGQLATHRLALALHRAGHEVHVLYSKLSGDCIQSDVPYRVHWTRGFDVATLNLDIFSFAFAINRLTRRHRFDIIHGNAEESFFTPCIAQRYGIPFVFTSHAPFIPATGIFRGMLDPINFLKRVNSYLLRYAAARASRIFAFSQFSKNLVTRALGDKIGNRITVVLPGIESFWFDLERSKELKQNLLFWGRIEDEKGIAELLQAMKRVVVSFPQARLTLIGEGNRLQDYQRLASSLGVMDLVNFAGWLPAEEIGKRASNGCLGIFPSRIESFGLSVAEAMAAGLPLIATKVGALPEFIEDGVTGILVPSGDVSALADAISHSLENPERTEAMAHNARSMAGGNFSWEATAENFVRIYQKEISTL